MLYVTNYHQFMPFYVAYLSDNTNNIKICVFAVAIPCFYAGPAQLKSCRYFAPFQRNQIEQSSLNALNFS